jgi:hypothetical protein
LLYSLLYKHSKTFFQIEAGHRAHRIKFTAKLLLKALYFLFITFQNSCESVLIEFVTFVSQQHLRDALSTVKSDLLQQYFGLLERMFVIEVKDHNCCLSMAKVVVDHSSIALVTSGVPQLQGICFALSLHFSEQYVDADCGLWLGIIAIGVFENKRGLSDRNFTNDNCFD